MPRITFDDLKLHRAMLEIRYSDGYRYWDISGKTITELLDASKGDLEFNSFQAEECQLNFTGNPYMRASFGFKHMTMSASRYKNFIKMKNFSGTMFSIIKKNINFSKCERVGIRFQYVLAKSNKEEVDEIIKKINLVQVDAERLKDFGISVENIRPSLVVNNKDLKININLSSANREGPNLMLSPEEEEYTPKYCLMIDFDYYKENIEMTDTAVEQFIHSSHKNFQENIDKILNI